MAVLPAAAGLAHVAALGVRGLPDGFLIRHLRAADVGLDVELAQHPVDDDLQVQLAHPGDQRLAGLLVEAHLEGRILLGELGQCRGQLVLVGLRLGLYGDGDDGLGELHRLEHDRAVGVAERVAGRRIAQPDRGHDVSRRDLRDVLPVIGVHLQDAADAFFLVFGGVVDIRPGLQSAGVHAEVRELADVGVGDDLEGQRRERLGRIGLARLGLTGLGMPAHHRRHVHRRGQVIHDRVQERLDALVAEGAAGEHRHDLIGKRPFAEPPADFVFRECVPLEVLVRQLVGHLRDGLDQPLAPLLGQLAHVCGDVGLVGARAQVVQVEGGLHADEVDDALEVVLTADRQLHRDGMRAQALPDHPDRAEEVRAGAVHLVHVEHAGDAVAVGLAPDGLGLRLDAFHGAQDDNRAVQHAQ